MGVTIGGDDAKSGKNTHLLAIMRVRQLDESESIQKVDGWKQRTESVSDYWGMRLMLHTPSYYYTNTNINLLAPHSAVEIVTFI